ncbi:DUF2938 domain-containing protein [Terrarubrum flagellatum]|uniref:DUF2938 domain-containing protein n=1 Tax=Terrirubrum flagellatum TaxID=2895980 RepID=UPI003144F628
MSSFILRSIVMGIVATGLTDLWAQALARFAGLPPPNWGLVGRWFANLTTGKVFHDDIGKAPPWANELAIGWAAHYLVGVAFAAAALLIGGAGWAASPTFPLALAVGWVTVGFGWFLLQPGMGAGWAASKRPNAMQIRILNVVSHTIFAIGLYVAALALAR